MGMVNAKQINAVAINAATSGYVDCSMAMAASSGGSCVATRVVSLSAVLPTQSSGDIPSAQLTMGVGARMLCESKFKVKLVIPIHLSAVFDSTSVASAQASEIFNAKVMFVTTSDSIVTKTAVLRKANPGIVFNKYSLQYLNAGRIIIHKNKYL